MDNISTAELDLSIAETLDSAIDDGPALARHPELREFRDRLGGTPFLEAPGPAGGARILAKHEAHNPFGSVKDRAAYALFCDAIARHGDRPEPLRLLDFSGGNMARALGGLGALTGLTVRLAMPDKTPPSLLAKLRADGAQIDFVDTEEFLYGIIRRASAIAAEEPGWTLLHQHRNVCNVAMHQFGTGAEILAGLDGRAADVWVAAIGTGGTLAGVRRALLDGSPQLRVIGVSPAELPYGTLDRPNARPKFAGSAGLGHGLRQPFVEQLTPGAELRTVSYEAALRGMREYHSLTGHRIGSSSAANWLVAREVAADLDPNRIVVTLFADSGTAEDWERVNDLRE